MSELASRNRAICGNLRGAIGCLPRWLAAREPKEALFLFRSEHTRRRPILQRQGLIVFAYRVPQVSQVEHLGKSIQLMIDTRRARKTMVWPGFASPFLILAE